LIEHFAYPLPITVIGDLVGVSEEDRKHWRRWSNQLVGFDRSDPSQINDALSLAVEHTEQMIDQRRAAHHDDLLGALVHARDEDGDRLTESELITLVFTLIIAGYETTAHLIGNGTKALLDHPEQWQMLQAERDLLPAAVHEMLRHGGTALLTRPRYAAEPVALHGTETRPGPATPPSRSTSTARRSPPERPSSPSSAAPTGIRACTRTPTASTSPGIGENPARHTPLSVTACTTAWARPWPVRKEKWPSTRCCRPTRTCPWCPGGRPAGRPSRARFASRSCRYGCEHRLPTHARTPWFSCHSSHPRGR